MFEHSRTRQRAFLGDVPHQNDRTAGLLGELHQPSSTFTHLSDGTRRRLQRFGPERLDRVDHHERGLPCRGSCQNGLETRFGQTVEPTGLEAEAAGPHGHLTCGLFPGDIEAAKAGLGLKQERRFADPGVAAQQHHGPGHQSAAEDAIELRQARRQALGTVLGLDLSQIDHLGRRRAGPVSPPLRSARRRGCGQGFLERVPGRAVRTLTGPFRKACAALAAGVIQFLFRHGVRITLRELEADSARTPGRPQAPRRLAQGMAMP